MNRLACISGCSSKGPACVLLEIEGRRILLDAGVGPDAGAVPPLEFLEPIDALLLSHAHKDHAGAMRLLKHWGSFPVYATETTLRILGIPNGIPLPSRGSGEVLGMEVRTGRTGHASGSIWIRFPQKGGFLYMGDSSEESQVYAFDPPPPSELIAFDASYGLYDEKNSLDSSLWKQVLQTGSVVLPVPAEGRSLEFVLLLKERGYDTIYVDSRIYTTLRQTLDQDRDYLRPGVAERLESVLSSLEESRISHPEGIHIVTDGEASEGSAAWQWITQYERDTTPLFLFTGYLGKGTTAERIVTSGRGLWVRWNAHPTLEENLRLIQQVGARKVIPMFNPEPDIFLSPQVNLPEILLLDGEDIHW